MNELIEKIETCSTIKDMNIFSKEEYNTINDREVTNLNSLLDSLDVDKNNFQEIKILMRDLHILKFSVRDDHILFYRFISIWGDKGWVYFTNGINEGDLYYLKIRFWKVDSLNSNWCRFQDD